MHVLKFEADKLSNSLNQGKCSEILTKIRMNSVYSTWVTWKLIPIDFVALLRIIDIDSF